jgi:hypothetical protein
MKTLFYFYSKIIKMALNKNAIIRYKTIDKCLQDRDRKWTLEELIKACSNALQTVEGKLQKVSKRTVQLDLQFMRDTILGYSAPITVFDKKYYTYSDENYRITNILLAKNDEKVLSETVELLKQYEGFSFYPDIDKAIVTIENKVKALKAGDKNSILNNEEEGILVGGETEELSNIKLLVSKKLFETIKKKPIHHSQIIGEENEVGAIELNLEVKITPEFEYKIIGLGGNVEVLQPESFRNEIVKKVSELSKVYGVKSSGKAKPEKSTKTVKPLKSKPAVEEQQSLF